MFDQNLALQNQVALNAELQRLNTARIVGQGQAIRSAHEAEAALAKQSSTPDALAMIMVAANMRVAQAEESVKEWRAAMEAWRDLAQALRDEVKACPNIEAHKFGKDDKARLKRHNSKEDESRVSLGLKPRFTAEEKGS
jgi:hypothetical protein